MPFPWKRKTSQRGNQSSHEQIRNYLSSQEKQLKDICSREAPGQSEACHLYGVFLETIRGNGAEAKAILRTNCERKYGPSCLRLGDYSSKGKSEAVELYGKACKLGEPEGCYKMAMKVSFDEEDEELKRWRIAERTFMEGCALGGKESCQALEAIYRRGLVPHKKRMILATSYDTSDLVFGWNNDRQHVGIEEAVSLVLALKDWEGLEAICKQTLGKEESPEKELDLLQELEALTIENWSTERLKISVPEANKLSFACLHGEIKNPKLCHRMADFMFPRHPDTAGLLYEHNCHVLDSPESCLQLGKAFLTGQKTSLFPKNFDQAADAFAMACELKDPRGCYLASLLRLPDASLRNDPYHCTKSVAMSENLLARGCAMNLGKSCVWLSNLYKTWGGGVDSYYRSEEVEKRWWTDFHLPGSFLTRPRSLSAGGKDRLLCSLEEFEACSKLSLMCKNRRETKR